MSTGQPDATTDKQPAAAGEPGPGSERAARLVLVGVLLLAMWGIVAVLPETAYVVVGVLATLANLLGSGFTGAFG